MPHSDGDPLDLDHLDGSRPRPIPKLIQSSRIAGAAFVHVHHAIGQLFQRRVFTVYWNYVKVLILESV